MMKISNAFVQIDSLKIEGRQNQSKTCITYDETDLSTSDFPFTLVSISSSVSSSTVSTAFTYHDFDPDNDFSSATE